MILKEATMENKTARLCKTTAVIIWILGCVASIVLAKDSFNFKAFIQVLVTSLLSVFILGLLIYAIGEIIQLLQDQKDRLPHVSTHTAVIENNKSGLISNNHSNLLDSANKEQRLYGKDWECRECKTLNPSTALYCKDCGTYR